MKLYAFPYVGASLPTLGSTYEGANVVAVYRAIFSDIGLVGASHGLVASGGEDLERLVDEAFNPNERGGEVPLTHNAADDQIAQLLGYEDWPAANEALAGAQVLVAVAD